MRTGFALVFLLGAALPACASYSPPQSQHFYTTSTQRSHSLSGLEIIYRVDTEGSVMGTYEQAALLTHAMMKYFVDGRLVASTNHIKPLRTFVQLPPGEHQLTFALVYQGVLTLGTEHAEVECVYDFTLARGQRGSFRHSITSKGKVEFSGIEDWRPAGECK
jgi:hypothetical protein